MLLSDARTGSPTPTTGPPRFGADTTGSVFSLLPGCKKRARPISKDHSVGRAAVLNVAMHRPPLRAHSPVASPYMATCAPFAHGGYANLAMLR